MGDVTTRVNVQMHTRDNAICFMNNESREKYSMCSAAISSFAGAAWLAERIAGADALCDVFV